MPPDPTQPRDAAASVLVRMTGPMRDALDEARRVTGLDLTNYIRQAIWRALVQDGFTGKLSPAALACVKDAFDLVRYNLDPLAAEPCANPVMDPADPEVPYDDCGECASCRARAALATIEIDLLDLGLGVKL